MYQSHYQSGSISTAVLCFAGDMFVHVVTEQPTNQLAGGPVRRPAVGARQRRLTDAVRDAEVSPRPAQLGTTECYQKQFKKFFQKFAKK